MKAKRQFRSRTTHTLAVTAWRSADFQSAVSRVSNLLCAISTQASCQHQADDAATRKSAPRIINSRPSWKILARHLLAAVLLTVALSSHAAVSPAVDFTSPGEYLNYGYPFNNVGWEFDVLEPVEVVALGYYDHNLDGLAASHPLGLWDPQGTLLARTNVAPSDPLTGFFRYRAIAPVRLEPGIGYRIGALIEGDPLYFARQVGGFSEHAGIMFYGNAVGAGAGLVYPAMLGSPLLDPGHFGPNFLLQPAAPLGPRLSLAHIAGQITVSWPAPADGWTLERTVALGTNAATTVWTPVSSLYQTNATHVILTANALAGHGFFRLRQSPSP
jgi:hypothetical protein